LLQADDPQYNLAADSVFVVPAEFITYSDIRPTLEAERDKEYCLNDAVSLQLS